MTTEKVTGLSRSRLIRILKSFSREDMKEFEKFLRSPFFGCPKFVLRFFLLLKKYHPDYPDGAINQEALYAKLYGGKKFNKPLMRRIVSDLIRQAEEYLKIRNFRNDNIYGRSCLINELSIRGLSRDVELKYGSFGRDMKKSPLIDPNRLLESFLVKSEVKNFRTSARDRGMNRVYSESIEELTVLYLRLLFSYANHCSTFPGEAGITGEIAESMIQCLERQEFLKKSGNQGGKFSDYLSIIRLCREIVEHRNGSSYKKLKKLLTARADKISDFEKLGCYAIMLRYCNASNLRNNNEMIRESFEIQKLILEEKLFLAYSQYLQLSFCRNFVIKCRTLDRIDDIRAFMKNYSAHFADDYKDELLNYCNALILFEEGEFEKALSLATDSDIDRAIFQKDRKILRLKLFYELNYTESLNSEIDSFRHFLSSNDTLKSDIISRGKKLLLYLSKLSKHLGERNTMELEILQERISKDKSVNEKKWLLEKLESLKDNSRC